MNLEKVDDVTCVSLLDEKLIDPIRIEQLGREMLALADVQPPLVVMSLKRVKFFSSAALCKLVVVERRIKARKGALILTDLDPNLYEIFLNNSLDQLFIIRENMAAALAELAPSRK